MSKILLIVIREVKTKLTNFWFWVATVGLPLIFLISAFAPIIISSFNQSQSKKIAVVDNSGQIFGKLKNEAGLEFQKSDKNIDDLKNDYKNQGFEAILYLPIQGAEKLDEAIIYSEVGVDSQVYFDVQTQLNNIYKQKQLENLKINKQDLDKINKQINLKSTVLSQGQENQNSAGALMGLSISLSFALYITIFIFGAMITMGVLEEKSSRISEVLLSSVKVFDLMMGKILGLALVGLIQLSLWILLTLGLGALVLGLFGSSFTRQTQDINNQASLPTGSIDFLQVLKDSNIVLLMAMFVIYFILGYLLYAAWFAAIGASSENTQQANNSGLAWIVTMPILVSMILMPQIITDPNGPIAIFFSLFPFTSPVIMLARIPYGVPWWQLVISIVFLILGFLGSSWVAAKIYKTGILMYGKKASLKEIWRWVRY